MSSVALFFSENSDSENENVRNLRRAKRRLRDHLNPLEMDTNMFFSNFRLSKDAFLDILDTINNQLPQGSYSTKIPPMLKLAMVLRFFAQGSYQLNVGNEGSFGFAQPTVSVFMSEMLNILERTLCPKYIHFNYSQSELEGAKYAFFSKCRIPGIIGAIDGTHVKILAPGRNLRHLYYNRKGFHSINVMLVCDHEMKIRFINATYPGSCHDSMIFNNSSLKAHLEDEYENGVCNNWLLGDAGYGLKPYLMTPFRNADPGSVERRYNDCHAKGRSIIECCIGVLKNRWRCTLGARALHYSPRKATQIINVCAALHNICILYKIPFDEEIIAVDAYNVPEIEINTETYPVNEVAESIRREIANFL